MGLGRKIFTRETLKSADVNGYLMDQVVAIFPSTAARLAAWDSPDKGSLSYLRDVERHDEFRGSAWVPFLGGARGQIATSRPAAGAGFGPSGNLYQLSQTATTYVNTGELVRHTVSIPVYGGAVVQGCTITVARFSTANARTPVDSRSFSVGGNVPDDSLPVCFICDETPPPGDWYWRVEASCNVQSGMAVVGSQGGALHTVDVVKRA